MLGSGFDDLLRFFVQFSNIFIGEAHSRLTCACISDFEELGDLERSASVKMCVAK